LANLLQEKRQIDVFLPVKNKVEDGLIRHGLNHNLNIKSLNVYLWIDKAHFDLIATRCRLKLRFVEKLIEGQVGLSLIILTHCIIKVLRNFNMVI
jgi:hypothetical protein